MTLRNRHPADELADVRAEIKQLQIREAELRHELLNGADPYGVQWQPSVWSKINKTLDSRRVIAHFGQDAMRPFFREIAVRAVHLKRAHTVR